MVEPGQAEGLNQKEMASSGGSDDTGELKHKRQRIESSEDENFETSAKKRRMSDNAIELQNHDLELNGGTLSAEENTKSTKVKDELNIQKEENSVEDKIDKPESPKQDEKNEKEEDRNEDLGKKLTKDNASSPSAEFPIKNESSDMEELVEKNDNDEINESESLKETEGQDKEKDENENSNKKLIKSEASSGLEVVEGLELSVECASEKESSSSENEEAKTRVTKTKTTIVKAKPTDSELEIASSEAEASDQEDESMGNSVKETKGKRGRKKGTKKSLVKKNSDSEDTNDSKSDEDYSPKTKSKLKKNAPSKKPLESKRSWGRGRKKTPKPEDKAEEKEDNGNDITNETENNKKENNKEEGESDNQSGSMSDDDSETESQSKGKGQKKDSSTRSASEKKLDHLKKYIRAAGIYVKAYADLFAKCKSNADKVRCLKDLLEKNGVTGRPTLEKCKKAKIRSETLKDISELNTSNIISEVRITRSQRNMGQNKELKKSSETPPKQREARSSFKRIMSVIDSDSE